MKQHIKTVREFNTWRRGGEMTCDEGYPKQLGEALDEVVKMAERFEEMESALKVIHTWAAVDMLVPKHVRELTARVLKL